VGLNVGSVLMRLCALVRTNCMRDTVVNTRGESRPVQRRRSHQRRNMAATAISGRLALLWHACHVRGTTGPHTHELQQKARMPTPTYGSGLSVLLCHLCSQSCFKQVWHGATRNINLYRALKRDYLAWLMRTCVRIGIYSEGQISQFARQLQHYKGKSPYQQTSAD
jgi:hypothetical protein